MDEFERRLLIFRKKEKTKRRLDQLKRILWKPITVFTSTSFGGIVEVKSSETVTENVLSKSDSATSVMSNSKLKAESSEVNHQEASVSTEESFNWKKFVLYVLIWCGLFRYAVYVQFGAVFLILSGFYIIWTNTRTAPRKANELSAYSVFNTNCERIEGTFDAEQFDKQIRSGMIF